MRRTDGLCFHTLILIVIVLSDGVAVRFCFVCPLYRAAPKLSVLAEQLAQLEQIDSTDELLQERMH